MPITRETDAEITLVAPLWVRAVGWGTMLIGLGATVLVSLVIVLFSVEGPASGSSSEDFHPTGTVVLAVCGPIFALCGFGIVFFSRIKIRFEEDEGVFTRQWGLGWSVFEHNALANALAALGAPIAGPSRLGKEEMKSVRASSYVTQGSTWGVPVSTEHWRVLVDLGSGKTIHLCHGQEEEDARRLEQWVRDRCGLGPAAKEPLEEPVHASSATEDVPEIPWSPTGEQHFRRGLELRDKGKWQEAIGEFDAAIRLNPNQVSPHAQRGFAYAESGRRDQAIADLERAKALTDDPDIIAYLEDAIKAVNGA